MAWTATENFDSYSAGSSISGDSGGSGWNGNWILGSAPATTENAPTGMSGKSLKSNGYCHRAITSINPTTSGTIEFSFQMMGEATNGSANFGVSQDGVAGRLGVLFDTDGHIHNLYGTTQDLGAYVANQVYTIKIKFGHASGKYAISIDGGAYSSDISMNGSSPWTMDTVFSDASGVASKYYWYDDIKAAINTFTRNLSDSISNGASRTVSIASTVAYTRALADSILNGASRLATVAKAFIRTISDSVMNGASRTTSVSRAVLYTRALADSILKGASRSVVLATTVAYIRAASVSILNGASRLATVVRTQILTRTLSDAIMIGANRFSNTIRVLINGSSVVWTRLNKSSAPSWTKDSKSSTSWTTDSKS